MPKHTLVHVFHDAYTVFNRYTHGLAKRPYFKNRHSHHSCYFDGAIHINRVGIKLPDFKLIHFNNYEAMSTDKQLANRNVHYKWFNRDLNAAINLANAKKYKVLINPVF